MAIHPMLHREPVLELALCQSNEHVYAVYLHDVALKRKVPHEFASLVYPNEFSSSLKSFSLLHLHILTILHT